MMPPLSTIRLCLRPVELKDVNGISSIVNDPLFARASIGCQMPVSDMQLLRWVISQQKQHQSGNCCCYTIRRTAEENLIGLVSLQQPENHADCSYRADLSYWLQPMYWRQGLMTEAVTAVMQQWLTLHPQSIITANSHSNNLASQALLQRVGMRLAETDETNKEGIRHYISSAGGSSDIIF
jgi:Acetyltransferases, including N-acetylases of ribosomal proteins